MKILSSSAEAEQTSQRSGGKGHRIMWSVYWLGAATLLLLWFVAGSVLVSYLFGGWIMIGALGLWFIEDAMED